MCNEKKEKSGSIGGDALTALFDLGRFVAVDMPPEPDEKPVYLKVAPGTDEYNYMLQVVRSTKVSKTKALRLLIKTGFLAFARSEERRKK